MGGRMQYHKHAVCMHLNNDILVVQELNFHQSFRFSKKRLLQSFIELMVFLLKITNELFANMYCTLLRHILN